MENHGLCSTVENKNKKIKIDTNVIIRHYANASSRSADRDMRTRDDVITRAVSCEDAVDNKGGSQSVYNSGREQSSGG